jgi:hypothetical protein
MPSVEIIEIIYENGWRVIAEIETDDGRVVGPQFVDLPETASVDEIKTAILEQYNQD